MASATRYCVLWLDGGKEHRSAWFSSRKRAGKALAIVKSKGWEAIVYVD